MLKDRLYTTAPDSLARRSAQTALWHITHAMLRWMAPILSFTAEEAWAIFAKPNASPAAGTTGVDGGGDTIFTETYWKFAPADEALLSRWSRIREIREAVNKAIEDVRKAGGVGSSLQAELSLAVAPLDLALLQSLGEDLKFVFITSAASLVAADEFKVTVTPSAEQKCERCWHYRADVGSNPAHPTICGRCDSNLHGSGETRTVA